MIIKILGNKDSQAYKIAEACVREKGYRVWNESTETILGSFIKRDRLLASFKKSSDRKSVV